MTLTPTVSNSHKCTASLASTPSASESKRARKTKLTGLAAVSEVADALHFVATHLTTNDAASSAEPSTPQHCTTAIRAVTTDTNLTCAEQIKLMGLFVKGIATADSYCNWPGVLNAPVSMGTGPNEFCSFVLPPLVPCTISIGAASCSLAQASSLRYRCPLSCSLFCIGMTCGSPCSSPNY